MAPLELAGPESRLSSGAPWWLIRDGLEERIGELPARADVLVVGAGITGALVADALSEAGLHVVVIDRRLPGAGSTAVSTALLQYELDVELVDLARMIGDADAERAYRVSADAIDQLADTVASLPDSCCFARRESLYLASKRSHLRRLRRECAARERIGLDVELLDAAAVEDRFGFPSHGALWSARAAVVDPVCLTRALLDRVRGRGGAVLPWTTAHRLTDSAGELRITVGTGEIAVRHVVLACGYEVPPFLKPDIMALHSTYALVTDPTPARGPLDRCLVWESARPYTYLRGVGDRVVIGGMDVAYRNALLRDELLPLRTRKLEGELRRLIPDCDARTAYAWAGTFGETRDGMPIIGPVPGCSNVYYALGYGGNGITFSAIAAAILRDFCLGRANDDARIFRPDR